MGTFKGIVSVCSLLAFIHYTYLLFYVVPRLKKQRNNLEAKERESKMKQFEAMGQPET